MELIKDVIVLFQEFTSVSTKIKTGSSKKGAFDLNYVHLKAILFLFIHLKSKTLEILFILSEQFDKSFKFAKA